MKRTLFVPLGILVASAPWLAVAACSSGQEAEAADAEAPDAMLAADSTAGDTGIVETGAVDQSAADVDARVADDGGTNCTFGDAMPDVARGSTCTGAVKAQRWAAMDQQPVRLPNRAAGLSLSGATDAGLTLAEAEQINCQSDDLGDLFGDCSRVASWGDNSEAWLNYDPNTGVGRFLVVFSGYGGALDFKSPDGTTSYSIGVGRQITKNGQPFTLDTGWSGPAFEAEVDELYRGIVATFAPTIALDPPGTACASTHKCAIGKFGVIGYVFIKAIGFAFWVPDVTAAQPAPSSPNRLDVDRL